MAAVAGRAFIPIPRYLGVMRVGFRLSMTAEAIEHLVVARVRVTGRAARPGTAMPARVDAEIEPIVIEVRRLPSRSRVTGHALRVEGRRRMIRIRRRFVVRPVARIAVGRRAGVLVVRVALRARDRRMRPGQREPCRCMIEARGLPGSGRVAGGARRRHAGRDVIRIRRRFVVGTMAGIAIRRGPGVAVVGVALRAGAARVRTREREPGRRMIEGGRLPGARRMASRTRRAEAGGGVRRIAGRCILSSMASVAIVRQARESASHVARRAGGPGVRSGQWEAGRRVIEARPRPCRARGVVALFAAPRIAGRRVVRARGRGVIGSVAGDAVARYGGEMRFVLTDVTARALEHGVHAAQREAGAFVAAHGIGSVDPAHRHMAILAADAVAALVHVAMAIGTLRRDPREGQRAVTVLAGGCPVLTGEREARCRMIEPGRIPHRRPALGGVAGFAGDADVAVRVGDGGSLAGRAGRAGRRSCRRGAGLRRPCRPWRSRTRIRATAPPARQCHDRESERRQRQRAVAAPNSIRVTHVLTSRAAASARHDKRGMPCRAAGIAPRSARRPSWAGGRMRTRCVDEPLRGGNESCRDRSCRAAR